MSLTCRTAREKTARVFPQPRVSRRKSIYSLTSIQPNPTAPQIAWALLVWRVAPCGSGMRHSSYTLHIYTWTDAEPGIRTGWPVHAGSAEKETLAAVFLYLRNEEARNKKREKEERSCAARMEASKVQASSRWITTFTNPWIFFLVPAVSLVKNTDNSAAAITFPFLDDGSNDIVGIAALLQEHIRFPWTNSCLQITDCRQITDNAWN